MFRKLKTLLIEGEDRLISLILDYSKERDYTKYTSTLREAWKASIVGLTNAFIEAIDTYDAVPELSPDEDYSKDPVAAFGIKEAKLHRERGIELPMFLGLMKYYRQSYYDLVNESDFALDERKIFSLFLRRAFDRIEIGFCTEWATLAESVKMDELQDTNRRMTNEKNKYLTIFSSLANPVILYNHNNEIENVNLPAGKLLKLKKSPGLMYYSREKITLKNPDWLKDIFSDFIDSEETEKTYNINIGTEGSERFFQVGFSKMLDVSEKFSGSLAIFYEITKSTLARRQNEALIAELKKALTNVKTLQKMLPICSVCKKIRNDEGFWDQVEVYITKHSDTEFSHGICPSCFVKLYPEFAED